MVVVTLAGVSLFNDLLLSPTAVESLFNKVLLSPTDSLKIDNEQSLWERWKNFRKKHILDVKENGVVCFQPIGLCMKLRRASGPHVRHNTYLRDFRKHKPQPAPFANYSCAPWIPKHQRRIHVTFMGNWNFGNYWTRYQAGQGCLAGEMYWAASLDYVLQHLGFEMVHALDLTAIQALQAGTSQAYIKNDNFKPSKMAVARLKSMAQDESVRCKTSIFEWWNQPILKGSSFIFGNETQAAVQENRSSYFDKRRFIYPFKDPQLVYPQEATSIPFFVHGEALLPTPTEAEAPRERRGFLLSKDCVNNPEVVLALLEAGFELHTTCTAGKLDYPIPDTLSHQIVHHGIMKPGEFSMVLRSMAFVLGFGTPTDSPTPFEGLYNGAAFLNPVFNLTRHGSQFEGKSTANNRDTQVCIDLKPVSIRRCHCRLIMLKVKLILFFLLFFLSAAHSFEIAWAALCI